MRKPYLRSQQRVRVLAGNARGDLNAIATTSECVLNAFAKSTPDCSVMSFNESEFYSLNLGGTVSFSLTPFIEG